MLKKITIEVLCDTTRTDEYIIKNMKTSIYKALDRSPVYISTPKQVKSLDVKVSTLGETSGQLLLEF